MRWKALGNIRLLIVDDDAFNRQLVVSLLGKIPTINFFQAEDGEEALSILGKRSVDMILLDLHMPKMDGYETLKVIKENPLYKSIPLAIITTDEQEMNKLYLLGADDFISKPFKLSELEARIYKHIEKRQNHSQEERITIPTKVNLNISDHIKVSMKVIEESQKKSLYTIAKLLNQREENLNNIEVTAMLTKKFALLIGYDEKSANNISYAAAIKNIGTISLKENLSLYDLSEKEQKLYRQSIQQGHRLLKNTIETNFIKMARVVIAQQKEHYDGSGFPKQLEGDAIHNVTYIATLVETFDALLSHKRYHNQKIHTPKETFEIIAAQSGQRFHPKITNLFLSNFEYFIQLREQIIEQNL